MDRERDYMTPQQASRHLRVHVSALYRWILSGKLPAHRLAGGRYYVRREDVDRLFAPVVPRRRLG